MYMITKIFFSMVLGMLAVAVWTVVAEANPSFKEGSPGLDNSYSSSYTSQSVLQEFKRDVRLFEERSMAAAEAVPAKISIADPEQPAEASIFKFHSGFSQTAVYESNLYDTRLDPIDDLITLPTAWMGVSRGKEGLSEYYFESDYGVTYMDYVENDQFDQMSHVHYTRLDWRGKKMTLGLENTFSPLSPKGTANQRELQTAGASRSVIATSNAFVFKSSYELAPKFTFRNAWSHSWIYYPESSSGNNRAIELQSNQIHSLSPRLEYQWTAKTTLFTNYQFQTADYFKGGVLAFKSHAATAGFETQLNPKTSWMAQAGYKKRSFNQPDFADGQLFIYSLALRRQVAKKFQLLLSVSGTDGDGPDTTDPADAAASNPDNGIHTVDLGAALSWAVSDRMQVTLNGGIDLEARNGDITLPDADNTAATYTRQRKDIAYSWGIGWRWARTAFDEYYIGYTYDNQNSSFKDFEFSEHQVIASVNLNLDVMGVGNVR